MPEWTSDFSERMERHFDTYSLSSLYAANAGSLLGNYVLKLEEELARSGAAGVARFLNEMAASYGANDAEPWLVRAMVA